MDARASGMAFPLWSYTPVLIGKATWREEVSEIRLWQAGDLGTTSGLDARGLI